MTDCDTLSLSLSLRLSLHIEQCIDSYRTYQQSEYDKQCQLQSLQKRQRDDDDYDSDDDDEDEDEDSPMSGGPAAAPSEPMDPRKIQIVEQVFAFCFRTGDFKHAIGIAIECRRLDRVEDAIKLSGSHILSLSLSLSLCECEFAFGA